MSKYDAVYFVGDNQAINRVVMVKNLSKTAKWKQTSKLLNNRQTITEN